MAKGNELVDLAMPHIGEKYHLGSVVPMDNPGWRGPWDCAEFASWLVFQATGRLYGCDRNDGPTSSADAYTGYWKRDVLGLGRQVTVAEAASTAGAFVLRYPPKPGVPGHIAMSNGRGGTVEAKGTKYGVVADVVGGRDWSCGVLVPWVEYTAGVPVVVPPAVGKLLRLGDTGAEVKALQTALSARGVNPGKIDGVFGDHTLAAVLSFQALEGLVVDGLVGGQTRAALGI